MMHSFFRKLLWLIRRRDKEAELREELQFYLAEEADEHEARGLAQEEARRAALRELGNLTLVEENTRAAWGWTLAEQFGQDLGYAFRTMRANRLFTALAVASLAFGIGANAAIYSFMDAILLRSLPVSDPQSLVVLNWHAKSTARDFVMHSMSGDTWGDSKSGETSDIFPYPVFELFRKSDSVFSSVFAHFQYWSGRKLNIAIRGQAEIGSGWSVSGDYFRGLELAPAAGRLIFPDDDRPGAPAVAVASYRFSREHFGEIGNAVGRSLPIDNVPFTLIGVTPPEFFGVDPAGSPDLYYPMHAQRTARSRASVWLYAESVSRSELLLDPDHGPVAARSEPGSSSGAARATVSPMGHKHRSQLTGEGKSSRTDRERRRGRAGQLAP
jgi:hypothetical protein